LNQDIELQLIRSCLGRLAGEGKLPADLAPEKIERGESIDALGIDSLGKTEFLLELERRRDGVLLSEHTDQIRTINDLCSLLSGGATLARDPDAQRNVDSREGSLSDYARVRSPDLFAKVRSFGTFLEDLRERGDEQYLLPVRRYRGARAIVDDKDGGEKEVIAFCSANYLGQSFRPEVSQAVADAAFEFGASVASVPLIAGSTSLHANLQRKLADFIGVEDVVLFPTGHAANIGTIAALAGPRDLIVLDKQVHYSILEGVRLAGASWVGFQHSDPEDLNRVLARARERHPDSGILVIVEGVYGIDGDIAPLPEIMDVARAHGARLMVDDAHATGVLGATGRGTHEHYGIDAPDIVMGSLSKSLGSMGGWIGTDKRTADYLRYFSKTIVFSVGLPAVNIAAALAAVQHIEDAPEQLEELRRKADVLKSGLLNLGLDNVSKSASSILSVLVGDERTLRDIVRELFDEGVWVEGLPFPAVTRGEERVRFRVSTLHDEDDLRETLEAVTKVFGKYGLIGASSTVPTQSRPFVELARDAARARGLPLPWLTPDFYERVVAGRGHWASERPAQWLVDKQGEHVVAACKAEIVQAHEAGEKHEVGFIGHVHWHPEHHDALERVLARAQSWLRQERDGIAVYGPIQAPLQILGGGIVSQGDPSRGPFLEPATSPDCYHALSRIGFERCTEHVYRRVSLAHARLALGDAPSSAGLPVSFRPLDRSRLKQEVEALLAPFNASIGRIDLCSPLDFDLFYGVARDLRELIVPELWQVAELDGRVVGFVGAFPEVSQGFLQAGGAAGVADLDHLKDLVDSATRGFVAWLAVDPDYQGLNLGKRLLDRVYLEMERRGYEETLLSWELRDGSLTEDAFAPSDAETLDRVEFEIYRS